jgi:uncharacterized lipoprotein YmbA
MKRHASSRLAVLPAVLAGLLAAGCSLPQAQPDLTRYYVLAAPTEKPAAGVSPAPDSAAQKPWTLGLRPVEAPPFLRNRAMLVRLGPNEVRFADESRWAEPVDAGVARVLRETLEARSDVARVVGTTVNAETPRDFDVLVRVERCEGARDMHVARFVAAVEIYSVGENPVRVAREVVTTEIPGWNGQDFPDLAAKLSEAVDQLAAKVVALLPEKR